MHILLNNDIKIKLLKTGKASFPIKWEAHQLPALKKELLR